MDPANSLEAVREAVMDVEGGGRRHHGEAGRALSGRALQAAPGSWTIPLAAYQVSGEYSMIKAADKMGWVDGEKVMMESLTGHQAGRGADTILTYFAPEAALELQKSSAIAFALRPSTVLEWPYSNMLRSFEQSDMEAVLKIWVEASLQSHDFVDPAYWISKVSGYA